MKKLTEGSLYQQLLRRRTLKSLPCRHWMMTSRIPLLAIIVTVYSAAEQRTNITEAVPAADRSGNPGSTA